MGAATTMEGGRKNVLCAFSGRIGHCSLHMAGLRGHPQGAHYCTTGEYYLQGARNSLVIRVIHFGLRSALDCCAFSSR